jgi:phosphoglycerol transferase MdoB-like AlkP superfamily enzyme
MSKTSTSSSSSWIGFCGLLTVAFIVLKLTHVIAWSWWWVLCPMWIGVAFVLAILAFVLAVAVLVSASDKPKKQTFEPRAGKTLGL